MTRYCKFAPEAPSAIFPPSVTVDPEVYVLEYKFIAVVLGAETPTLEPVETKLKSLIQFGRLVAELS